MGIGKFHSQMRIVGYKLEFLDLTYHKILIITLNLC